ncbi:delta-aminolevulinic acid dehydratase [Paenibacillus phocaensis]|uniref:delta-aminolevulinic acid dehydratase n=1 Tax=Paenibacillus phocaensis TaxID=1776378 RepID=UPI000839D075|nr:delta-aminolevulinic acid dehydratase [Paenibacillus phocaensis]
MSKPQIQVALVCGPDCDMEVQAIRSTLEYFGARVFTYWIGRPSDFISVLTGGDIYSNTDYIILSFHGTDGKFVMPELGEDVYEADEPRGNFGPNEIRRFASMKGKVVIANGCTLGMPETAEAFLNAGCATYIAPDDFPNGSMGLMFVLRLFYEIIENKKDVKEAFHLTQSMDNEMRMYRFF